MSLSGECDSKKHLKFLSVFSQSESLWTFSRTATFTDELPAKWFCIIWDPVGLQGPEHGGSHSNWDLCYTFNTLDRERRAVREESLKQGHVDPPTVDDIHTLYSHCTMAAAGSGDSYLTPTKEEVTERWDNQNSEDEEIHDGGRQESHLDAAVSLHLILPSTTFTSRVQHFVSDSCTNRTGTSQFMASKWEKKWTEWLFHTGRLFPARLSFSSL